VTEPLINQIQGRPDRDPEIPFGLVAVVPIIVGALTFVLVYVVPVFANVYRQFSAELPVGTRAVLLCSTVLQEEGNVLLSAVALLSAAATTAYCIAKGRAVLNETLFLLERWLNVPVLVALAMALMFGILYSLYLPIYNLGTVIR
jgi:type II secretory pathway component PulF